MNWIFSDRTPFLLGLLFALLTWQAGELFKEVRSGKALVYTLTAEPPDNVRIFDGKTIALRVENPSRTEAVEPFTFTLLCKEPPCLTGNVSAIEQAPMLPQLVEAVGNDSMTLLQADLPPGGVVWLVAETPNASVGSEDQFKTIFQAVTAEQVVAAADAGTQLPATDVRVIDGTSTEGWIVTGWLDFLYKGMVAVLAAIGLWLIAALLQRFWPQKWLPVSWRKDPKDAAESAPESKVTLEVAEGAALARIAHLEEMMSKRHTELTDQISGLAKGDGNGAG